jgi:putative ABC transport system permease protein
MGMSRGSIVGMLLCEQVLVSGVAIGIGVLLGNLASRLFVPLFQLVFSAADQPLHFQIVSSSTDTARIYFILGGILVICFAVLTRMILRIRIDQAVKLGEE